MPKYELIITVDDELPAGGAGDPLRDMLNPTKWLLDVCESHGAKLTVMIEMGELWAFEDSANETYAEWLGYNPAASIREQLGRVIAHGHDVQLHLHPQWVGARWRNNAWELDYAHYCLTDFDHEEASGLLRRAKQDLESMLRPSCPGYSCVGYRAGHWNTWPSGPYLAALSAAGLLSDTSVFKGGYADSCAVRFDYRAATSYILPWIAHPDDINQPANNGAGILEIPISTRMCRSYELLTPRRLLSATRILRESRRIAHAAQDAGRTAPEKKSLLRRIAGLLALRPMKLDFCKLSASQMLAMIERLFREYDAGEDAAHPAALVMIGHSKQAGGPQELNRFLAAATRRYGEQLGFSTYQAFVERWLAEVAAPDRITTGGPNHA